MAGGDGTLGRVAPAFLDARRVLGIIPSGTGNALAHELGIPMEAIAAIEFAMTRAVEGRTDVGLANGRTFVTTATMGLSTAIGRELEGLNKKAFGRLAYLPALARAYQSAAPIRALLTVDGASIEGRFLQIVVAASRNHSGPFLTTPGAARDDRKLSVYAVRGDNRAQLLRYGCSLLLGRHTHLRNVRAFETTQAHLACPRIRTLVIDGDPVRGRDFSFALHDEQLALLMAPEH